MRRYNNKPLTETQRNHDDSVTAKMAPASGGKPNVLNDRVAKAFVPRSHGGARRYGYSANTDNAPVFDNRLAVQLRIAPASAVVETAEEVVSAEPGWGPWDAGAEVQTNVTNYRSDGDIRALFVVESGAVIHVGHEDGDDDNFAYAIYPSDDLSTPTETIEAPGGSWVYFEVQNVFWDGSNPPIAVAETNATNAFFTEFGEWTSSGGFSAYFDNSGNGWSADFVTDHYIQIDSAGNRHVVGSIVDRNAVINRQDRIFYIQNDGTPVQVNNSLADTNVYGIANIAVDPNDDNNLIILASWDNPSSGDSEYFYYTSTDAGSNWSSAATLSPFINSNTFSSGDETKWSDIAWGNGVIVAVAPLDPYQDLSWVYSTDGGSTWSGTQTETITGSTNSVWQIRVSASGNYFAFFEMEPSGGKQRVIAKAWDSVGETWSEHVALKDVREDGDLPTVTNHLHTDVAMRDDGGLKVAMMDTEGGTRKIYRRSYINV